jgi:hypothetical protein
MRGVNIDTFDALITKHTEFPRIGKGRHSAIAKATGIAEQTIKGWYTRGCIPEFQIKKIEEKCNIELNKIIENSFIFSEPKESSHESTYSINFTDDDQELVTANISVKLPMELMLELIQSVKEISSRSKNH